jgi:hypothetical protein
VPRGASKTAGHSLIACADAAAVAAADQAFAEAAGAASGRSLEAVQDEQRLLRCLLKDVIQASKLKKGDGRVLCYGGQAAAAAAKFGRPMDLRSVAARIDAGWLLPAGRWLLLLLQLPVAKTDWHVLLAAYSRQPAGVATDWPARPWPLGPGPSSRPCRRLLCAAQPAGRLCRGHPVRLQPVPGRLQQAQLPVRPGVCRQM